MRSSIALLLFAACALAQDPPSIRVDVNLINVAFMVHDAGGALTPALTEDDFEVSEDGISQTISFFSRGADLPLTLGIVVDASGSQEHFVKQHKRDLQVFLKSVLGPRDRAFMVGFGNHIRLVSGFSGSGERLAEGLDQYERHPSKFPELGPPEDRDLGTAFYDAIYYSCTEQLAKATEGRKALIVFSDGEDNSSSHHLLDAIEAAQTADAPVFAVRYTEPAHGRLTARNKYGTSVMARIALETGGADFDARKADLKRSFEQIGEELRLSYELAYKSANPERDGTFRKIRIRPRQPGLTARAKAGYWAR